MLREGDLVWIKEVEWGEEGDERWEGCLGKLIAMDLSDDETPHTIYFVRVGLKPTMVMCRKVNDAWNRVDA